MGCTANDTRLPDISENVPDQTHSNRHIIRGRQLYLIPIVTPTRYQLDCTEMDVDTIFASVLGSVGSKLVFHPLDTLRTLQQTSTNFNYILPIRRYWQGLGASLALTTPAFTVYMVSYRQCKKELTPYLGDSALPNYIISSSVAELASSGLWTPMEVVKGRMQIHQGPKATTLDLIQDIYRTSGIKGFFRGYWMGILVFLPHSVVWWLTYEDVKKRLVINEDEQNGLHYGVASAVASTAAATASNFLDVVKTRQQLAVSNEISAIRPDDQLGIWKVARNFIKEQGVFRALFRGLHLRLLHSLPSSVLAMVIIETIHPDKSKQDESESVSASVLAAMEELEG